MGGSPGSRSSLCLQSAKEGHPGLLSRGCQCDTHTGRCRGPVTHTASFAHCWGALPLPPSPSPSCSPPCSPLREGRPLPGPLKPQAPAQKPCHCGLTGATVFTVPDPPGWSPFPPLLPTPQQLKDSACVSHPGERTYALLVGGHLPWNQVMRGPQFWTQASLAKAWTPGRFPGAQSGTRVPGPRGPVHTQWSKPPSWPFALSS